MKLRVCARARRDVGAGDAKGRGEIKDKRIINDFGSGTAAKRGCLFVSFLLFFLLSVYIFFAFFGVRLYFILTLPSPQPFLGRDLFR